MGPVSGGGYARGNRVAHQGPGVAVVGSEFSDRVVADGSISQWADMDEIDARKSTGRRQASAKSDTDF